MDGLFVKCFFEAVLYFGPQDVTFLIGLGWIWHTKVATVSPQNLQPDAEAAVEAFKAKKGLEDVKVPKGSRTWLPLPAVAVIAVKCCLPACLLACLLA